MFLNLLELAAHFASKKVWRDTKKIVKLKKTSKNSCFTLNKLKLAICVQSNCANYHLQTTKIQLMHTGLGLYFSILVRKLVKAIGKNLAAHFVGAHGTPVEKH